MANTWTGEQVEQQFGMTKWGAEQKSTKQYARETKKQKTTLQIHAGVPFLSFSIFEEEADWMGMAFSTKLGGISQGYLAEMNFGWNRGDDDETVRENYRIMSKALQIAPERLVFSDQVHDTKVEVVTEKMAAGDKIEKHLVGVDGMITEEEELVLATSYADCVPLFFADPVHKVVASSHSGWRGTVGEIGAKTIKRMQQEFGSEPGDIRCLVGPSICQDCYEVSEEVAEAFRAVYEPSLWDEILAPGKMPGKYQLDLYAACYETLKKAGALPEHIQVSGVCTCCHSSILFSHRATAGKRGNLNGFIWKRASQEVPES